MRLPAEREGHFEEREAGSELLPQMRGAAAGRLKNIRAVSFIHRRSYRVIKLRLRRRMLPRLIQDTALILYH